jgi:hypothetical protein
MRLRKRINELSTTEEDRLRSAFGALMSSSDPSNNYAFWASLHRHCPHGSQLFLPWHRAYILALETALRAVPGCAEVTLPYWDWTVVRQIPPLVQVDPMRSDRYPNPDPSQLPSVAEIQQTLRLDNFLDFGGAGCFGVGTAGTLENYHGDVHKWVGPIMAEPRTASRDPIFWFHHSFVDRVWALWQESHTGNPCPFALDTVLAGLPGQPTVRSVLDSRALGYEYVDAPFRLEGARVTGERPITIVINLPSAANWVRLRLDEVSLASMGTPPDALDVYVGGSRTRAALISLFGMHHGHEHEQGHDRDARHAGHGGDGRIAGAPGALVPISIPGELKNAVITLVPRWPAGATQRAAFDIRAVQWSVI